VFKSPDYISDICRKHNIAQIKFARWKKQYLEGGLNALKLCAKSNSDIYEKETQKLKLIIGDLYVELEYLKKKGGNAKIKNHLPVGFWDKLFKDIEENNLKPDVVRRTLGLATSTSFLKRKQFNKGGIHPRKPSSGRPIVFHAKTYDTMITKILKGHPPVVGHKRI
jgi:hypothetical protein